MRKTHILSNNIYHVYNRGINRQKIFFLDDDYLLFISKLKGYFKNELANVLCYCLMPNHYHLIVHVNCDEFGKKVLLPLMTSYIKIINRRENRVGTLFQGQFQSLLIETDQSLMETSRYIHMNPIKAGLVTKAEKWSYSSYRAFIGLIESDLIHKEEILEFFPNVQEYRKFVEETNF